jgi:hypothetical protein
VGNSLGSHKCHKEEAKQQANPAAFLLYIMNTQSILFTLGVYRL